MKVKRLQNNGTFILKTFFLKSFIKTIKMELNQKVYKPLKPWFYYYHFHIKSIFIHIFLKSF